MVRRPLVLLEMVGVFLDEVLPFVGHLNILKDGLYRAFWHAGAAVNTLIGVNKVLLGTLIDAVYGADLDTGSVFDVDTWFADDVWHGMLLPLGKDSYQGIAVWGGTRYGGITPSRNARLIAYCSEG
jgi:hypothetical protein